ncbi:glutamate--tRNA ligase [Patescibacteria group bacterium]|nr:glutamate--tRNA ligase [Patescibacteria group bacterium]
MSVKVRFCPSPTGLLHIGTIRTCLYNFLFAKQNNGKIVFRMEDTDKNRSTKKYAENIISGLKNLGIYSDEGIGTDKDENLYYQSNRGEIYKKYLLDLLYSGNAYFCFCTKEELDAKKENNKNNGIAYKYDGKCRPSDNQDSSEIKKYIEESEKRIKNGENATIRLKINKNERIKFNDLVRGDISFNTDDFDDFIIAKSINEPLYNFTVVIDDYEMKISHIIRGEDHITNTPKQILIYKAFNFSLPEFAHLPLILNEDKTKLSKRKNKVSVDDYLSEGYLKEAILNFLFLLGFNTPDEKEIFSLSEMIEVFNLSKVHKGGAVFDMKKLNWINSKYIRDMEFSKFLEYFKEEITFNNIDKDFLKRIAILEKERINKFSDIKDDLFLFEIFDYNIEDIINEKMGVDLNIIKTSLENSLKLINNFDIDYNLDKNIIENNLKEGFIKLINDLDLKNGQVLWPLRYVLSGVDKSPGVFELIWVLGKEESIKRINFALNLLQK